jgi:hypothetical protein
MLIFIDDSGDPGFKFEKGSSLYFVIALLIFDDTLEAEKMAVAVKELRRALKISDHEEFKFNKSNDRIRQAFLKTISQFSFRIRCLVVNKKQIYSPELKGKKESFYAYFIKEVLKHSNNTILDAKIRIDGSGDREFKKQFLTYLRKELNAHDRNVMRNCKMVDSRTDVLIQSVDMIAGAIRRFHERGDVAFRNSIESHIEDEWMFR